jgi:cation transporter-like permease
MTASTTLTEVRRSRPYHTLVGVGLVSYGLLYLVVAWIALQLVFGKRAKASPEGALSQLAKQPLGGVLL